MALWPARPERRLRWRGPARRVGERRRGVCATAMALKRMLAHAENEKKGEKTEEKQQRR